MKAVLISIQPKWCAKIANGEKTIEVRKTRPKLETPFKVYIYCTNTPKYHHLYDLRPFDKSGDIKLGCVEHNSTSLVADNYINGKVIGEFVCDRIDDFSKWEFDYPSLLRHINLFAGTNGNYKFLDDYLKGKKKGYGWNISKLKIYDKPKELSKFRTYCGMVERFEVESVEFFENCIYCPKLIETDGGLCTVDCGNRLTRPPQSWCYVEEV